MGAFEGPEWDRFSAYIESRKRWSIRWRWHEARRGHRRRKRERALRPLMVLLPPELKAPDGVAGSDGWWLSSSTEHSEFRSWHSSRSTARAHALHLLRASGFGNLRAEKADPFDPADVWRIRSHYAAWAGTDGEPSGWKEYLSEAEAVRDRSERMGYEDTVDVEIEHGMAVGA